MGRWKRIGQVALVIASILVSLATAGQVAAQEATPAATPAGGTGLAGAVAWLQSQQADDGGFIGFSGESDPGATIDAMVAFAAAEAAGVDTGDSIERALAYLESGDVALVYVQTGVGQAAKLALGLVAVGVEPAGFAQVDPMSIIERGASDTGLYGMGVYDHALAVQAIVATGGEVPAAAIDAFAATQASNGGWAFDATTDDAAVDSNTTAMAVQALVTAGEGDGELVTNGVAYLESTWTDGGALYNTLPDSVPDANSTALVIQGLLATGADVTAQQEVLARFQNPGGAFRYNDAETADNLFATLQAIPALASATLPDGDATPVA